MSVGSSANPANQSTEFAQLLDAFFAEKQPERGDVVTGTILAVDSQGLIVDVGLKRDGIVSRRDIEHMGLNPTNYQVGEAIDVIIIRVEDQDGNLLLSVSQAQQSEDWKRAEDLFATDGIYEAVVTDANKGGLIVPFGNLRGFVPASHVVTGISRCSVSPLASVIVIRAGIGASPTSRTTMSVPRGPAVTLATD